MNDKEKDKETDKKTDSQTDNKQTDRQAAPRPDMPPVPRDYNEPSYSELVPLKSSTINIFKSPIFYLVIFTGLATLVGFDYMFELMQRPTEQTFITFGLLSISYLLALLLLVLFIYSRTDKPFWVPLLNAVFVALLLTTSLGIIYFVVFRGILPGGEAWTGSNDFFSAFIGMFFGAGLMEELMKVTLVLLLAYMSLHPQTWQPRLGEKWFEYLRVRGPLDGMLLGLCGGAGFILIETGLQYVPGQLKSTYEATGDGGASMAYALMLMLPRTIGGIVGHMGWAGINGYFIGLWVARPKDGFKYVIYAWLGTSALHAMWNTSNFFEPLQYLAVGAGGVFLVACLLKARQIAMSHGRYTDTYGSIVVGADAAADAPQPAAPAAAPRANPAPAAAPQANPAPAAAPASAPPAAAELRLVFESATLPVAVGPLDLSQIPALAGATAAEITQHPVRADVLGLKNNGSGDWTATLRDGSLQTINPGRNIRLANGVKIDFGAGITAEVLG